MPKAANSTFSGRFLRSTLALSQHSFDQRSKTTGQLKSQHLGNLVTTVHQRFFLPNPKLTAWVGGG